MVRTDPPPRVLGDLVSARLPSAGRLGLVELADVVDLVDPNPAEVFFRGGHDDTPGHRDRLGRPRNIDRLTRNQRDAEGVEWPPPNVLPDLFHGNHSGILTRRPRWRPRLPSHQPHRHPPLREVVLHLPDG